MHVHLLNVDWSSLLKFVEARRFNRFPLILFRNFLCLLILDRMLDIHQISTQFVNINLSHSIVCVRSHIWFFVAKLLSQIVDLIWEELLFFEDYIWVAHPNQLQLSFSNRTCSLFEALVVSEDFLVVLHEGNLLTIQKSLLLQLRFTF